MALVNPQAPWRSGLCGCFQDIGICKYNSRISFSFPVAAGPSPLLFQALWWFCRLLRFLVSALLVWQECKQNEADFMLWTWVLLPLLLLLCLQ